MEQGRNRVFINPNFNKRIINNVPDNTLRQATVMHVNPNFCQHSQNLQPMPKSKIYINPNFVRPNGVNNHFPYVNNTTATQPYVPYVKPSPLMDSSNTLTVPVIARARHGVQSSLLTNTAPMQPVIARARHGVQSSLLTNTAPMQPVIARARHGVQSSLLTNTAPMQPVIARARHGVQSSLLTNTAPMQPVIARARHGVQSSLLTNTAPMQPVIARARYGVQSSLLTNTAPMQPFQTNSRYSLVRQKKPEEPNGSTSTVKPVTSTIKISKYKSIKMTDIKRNLEFGQPIEKLVPFEVSNSNKSFIRTSNNHKCPKIPTNHINRYRFVKPQFKRQISNTLKKVVCNRTRIKAIGVYKKNNIPCPQYRKYGKCLRKSYGKCEFLHDKKHVSICRRFLNGVCHNDKCLLSHELSDKKMPTCYFYLKGMCTKEGCPYLHVKLNEKAKICSDFIRGYCEKGDQCLNRHVAKSLNAHPKRIHSLKKLTKQEQLKLTKYKLEKNKVKSNMSSMQKRKSKIQLNQQPLQDSKDSASRYYKESVQESNVSENLEIKPSRCKLGTLPSFIQL